MDFIYSFEGLSSLATPFLTVSVQVSIQESTLSESSRVKVFSFFPGTSRRAEQDLFSIAQAEWRSMLFCIGVESFVSLFLIIFVLVFRCTLPPLDFARPFWFVDTQSFSCPPPA